MHTEDALALGAEEGRSKLRKAMGSRKQTLIHGCPNGETRYEEIRIIRIRTHKIRKGTQGTETS